MLFPVGAATEARSHCWLRPQEREREGGREGKKEREMGVEKATWRGFRDLGSDSAFATHKCDFGKIELL